MASNLSQTFICNDGQLIPGATTNFGSIVGSTTAANHECGIWDSYGQAWITANQLYSTTNVNIVGTDADDPADGIQVADELVVTEVSALTSVNPAWHYSHLQFAQGMPSGNPIATPVIPTANIKSIQYTPHTASVGAKHTITDNTMATSKDRLVKFVIRTTPTAYEYFVNNEDLTMTDLSGESKEFPLAAFNTTNHKVFNIEVLNSELATDNLAGFCAKLEEKVDAHGILSKLINVTTTTTSGDTYTARHAGVDLDIMITLSDTGAVDSTLTNTKANLVIGAGNDWQAISDEKGTRGKYGNFNRMYFPTDQTTFTQSGFAYDVIDINYNTPNWPVGAGIAPAGQTNSVRIYVGSSGTALLADGSNSVIDTLFQVTVRTAKRFVWS
jgi:hypothetical protein